jgi:ABC-type sugar transport system ATPase subunit
MAGYRPIDANADLIRDEREPITRGRPTEFRVEGLRLAGRVDDVTITAAPGEVVGLAGLVGSGRSSILRCIAGVESKALGAMTVEQRRARVPRTVRAARRLGIVLIPEDRKTEGLIGGRSVEDNISLSSYRSVSNLGVVRPRRQRVLSDSWRSRVHLTSHRPGVKARMLSGGNQQKVLLARVLEVRPRIVLADEPTRGVDVAAKEQLLGTLRAFADNGGSVVMTSSEIEEVLSVSDRVYVIHDGRVVKELHDIGPHVSVESVLRLCFGNDDSV